MNGRVLTLGLVGALAVGAALGRRGSLAASPFTTGYCLAFAKVLKKRLGRGAAIYDVVEPDDPDSRVTFFFQGTPHHAVVAWKGLFLDANGAFTEDELLARWNERAPSEIRRPLHLELHNAARAKDVRLASSCPAYLLWDAENIAKRVEEEARHRLGKRGSRATDPTSTPAFRRWFGESKVVDEAGRPLVVYHGTTAGGFDAFRPNYRKGEQLGFGIHFAHDRSVAELYADPGRAGRKEGSAPKVYEVYLSLRNPIDFTQRTFIEGTPEFGVMNDLLQQVFEGDTDHLYEQDGNGVRLLDTAYRNYLDALPGPMVERTLRDVGFDGVIYNALILGERRRRAIAYIAFRPEQIKSATGNRGTFDPADPRISYNRRTR
jgi:hypothetical protein